MSKKLNEYENSIVNTGHEDFLIHDSRPEAYKEYRRKWEQNAINMVLEDAPIHVDLELNSTCNLKCVMCYYSYAPPEAKIMKLEDARAIIKECADSGVYSMKFQLRGEPLLYKHLPALIAYAKKLGIVETMINTNGTLLYPNMAKSLIDAGLDKIIISIDGLEKEVYESIRVGADFDNVKQNTLTLMALKQLHNKTNPTVRVQWINQLENKDREEDFINYWKDKVDEVGMNHYLDWDPNGKIIKLKNWHCGQLWQRFSILADGDVIPCCCGFHNGGKVRYSLGNIFEMRLSEIWHSKKMRSFRELHRKGNSHQIDMCNECGQRAFAALNVIGVK